MEQTLAHPSDNEKRPRPRIAVVVTNTLAALGLAELVHRLMPGAEVHIADGVEELLPQAGSFFHFFTDTQTLLAHAAFFLARQPRTIVLVHGDEGGRLPQGFHTLNVCRQEQALVRDFVRLAGMAHGAHGREPEAVRQARMVPAAAPQLTARETEVLQLVVRGLINKEIAERLGVSPATVISHRKNLAEKLGTRGVPALTIYAVAHGLVQAEDI